MKKWRIDMFIGVAHNSEYFDSKEIAIMWGETLKKSAVKNGADAKIFLLKRISEISNKYDVVKMF